MNDGKASGVYDRVRTLLWSSGSLNIYGRWTVELSVQACLGNDPQDIIDPPRCPGISK